MDPKSLQVLDQAQCEPQRSPEPAMVPSSPTGHGDLASSPLTAGAPQQLLDSRVISAHPAVRTSRAAPGDGPGAEPGATSTAAALPPGSLPDAGVVQDAPVTVDYAPQERLAAKAGGSGGAVPPGGSPSGGSRVDGGSDHTADGAAGGGGGAHSPPGDPLEGEVLARLMQRALPEVGAAPRFRVSDMLRDPQLAKAARRELDGQVAARGASEDPDMDACLDTAGHDAEIERQRAATRAVDASVAAESKLSREWATLVLERVEHGRKSLEGLLRLVTAMASAEHAYAAAMGSAAALRMNAGSGEADTLRAATAALAELPSALAAAHGQLQAVLRERGDGVRALLDRFTRAGKDLSSGAATGHRSVEAARRQLAMAFLEHKAACEAFDAALGERPRGRLTLLSSVEQDPWVTEGRLVQEHQALQCAQSNQRSFLRRAFNTVQELEAARLAFCSEAMTSLGGAYSAALGPLASQVAAVQPLVSAADGGAAELAELARVAAAADSAAAELAGRQAEATESVCQELFCSPEIVRQGGMQAWSTRGSCWDECHFVLTRAGFLHWFASPEEAKPLDMLNLARCQFEAGNAPVFNLVEAGGASWLGRGSRKTTFQAPSVEECCEWAVALREAIALASARHHR